MRVAFISPHFPPAFWLFVRALRGRGASVLGLGDAPPWEISPDLRACLSEYVHVPDLEHYDDVLRAFAGFVHRGGRIDRVASLNEHWLGLEARLREDFNVPGPRPDEMRRRRSKAGMAAIMAEHGIEAPACALLRDADDARRFAREHGFPMIIKPDLGVGATGAARIDDAVALERRLAHPVEGFVAQPFVEGRVTTFDGLADRSGEPIFSVSFVYCDGVMEIVGQRLDVWFATRRDVPPALASLGERLIRAFDVREGFFHIEAFERSDGTFVPLEVNLRPPGGFTVDVMNFACDVDLYRLWAEVVTGADTSGFSYERKYHAAHVSRREGRRYRYDHDELVARLGPALVACPWVPPSIAWAMGAPLYIVRHPDVAELHRLIALVHEPA